MKHYLQKYVKPKTKAELEQGIYDFWATMTPAKCSKYIGHLTKVVPEVLNETAEHQDLMFCIYTLKTSGLKIWVI